MKNEDLRDSLTHLHSELDKVRRVDEASNRLLKRLDEDIRRILENSGDAPDSHHTTLRRTLEDSVKHFEFSHPALTSLMNRIINALGAMGI